MAVGAHSREAVPGAVTFRGPMSAGVVEQAIARVAAEPDLRLAFVAPAGARWLLPLYELALLAAAELREYAIDAPDVLVATPEHVPLEALGPAVGEAVRGALDRAGVDLVTSATAVRRSTARYGSRTAASSTPTSSSPSPSSSARASPGCRTTKPATCPSTSTGASSAAPTSSLPGTRPRSRSSTAAWPPSRRTPSPRRSARASARSATPSRCGRSCARSC